MRLHSILDAERSAELRDFLSRAKPEIEFFGPDAPDIPQDIRFLFAYELPENLEQKYPELEIVFCISAGVDHISFAELPDHVRVVRMVDPGLTSHMVEFATMGVLALARDLPVYLEQQRQRLWKPAPVRLTSAQRVGVMGLGEIGRAVLDNLRAFDFELAGWSRRARQIDGVQSFFGADQFEPFLERTDILVCLLPLTDETHGILSARAFDRLPSGAALLHIGRGAHLESSDLLAALDSAHLRAAFLDVTNPEPLPESSPLWHHPRVIVTPHVAGATVMETAARVIVDNLERYENSSPLIGEVDRELGY